jgi:hypothetical protein
MGPRSLFHRSGGHAACALMVALAATLTAASTIAQVPDSVRAEALFREGRDAMRRHQFIEACDKFQQSDELDPSPGTRLNWALCEESLGHLVQSLLHAHSALDQLSPEDDRHPIAARLVAELAQRVARLTVRLPPTVGPNARVYLDGEPLGMQGGDEARMVDPGEHVIVVEQAAHDAGRVLVTLREGESAVRAVSVGQEQRGVGAGARGLAPIRPRASSARRTAGYALAASAGVGLVATTVLGILAAGEHDVVARDCPDRLCNAEGFDAARRGRAFVNLGTVTLGFSVANAAAAAFLLWPTKSATAASVVPLAGGVGLGIVCRF